MLFRPYNEKRALGVRIPFTPGLIPKRRYTLAKKTGQTIAEHLLTDDALIERFCTESVKKGVEGVIDSLLESALASKKTLGSVIFGEESAERNEQEAALLKLKASGILSGIDINELAIKLDNRILSSDKKIGGLLDEDLNTNLRSWLSRNTPEISDCLLKLVRSPVFSDTLKPVAIEVINRSVRGFASLFVIPESVYGNFLKGIASYLENPDNYPETEKRILNLLDTISHKEISAIAHAIVPEDGRLFTALLEKASAAGENGDALSEFAEIMKTAGEQAGGKLVTSLLSMEVGALFSKIGPEFRQGLKNAVMSRYDTAVRSGMPRVLEAVGLPGVIEAKINDFEMKEAEEIIVSVVDRELKAITYFGGLLGFIIGLAPPILQEFGL